MTECSTSSESNAIEPRAAAVDGECCLRIWFQANDIRAYLQQGPNGDLRLPDGYSTDCENSSIPEEWDLIFHEGTGIFMWSKPLCPMRDENAMLLYCYTGEENFCAAFRSESPWLRLVADLATTSAESRFGRILYATARPPDAFESKEAMPRVVMPSPLKSCCCCRRTYPTVLINMSNDSEDDIQETVSRQQSMADFCIPILVARQNVKKVTSRSVPVSHGPGSAELQEDRDLWVVSLTDDNTAVSHFAARLKNVDVKVRQDAIIQIGPYVAASDDPANVDLLFGCLEDKNADVRRNAVNVLTALVDQGHDRTLEGIADIFNGDVKHGIGPGGVSLHDSSPPLLLGPGVPPDIEMGDLDMVPPTFLREEPTRDDCEPLSHDCIVTTGKLVLMSLLDLILLVVSGVSVTNRIHQRNGGFLETLADVFLLITFVLSAVGCISGTRINRELIAHGRTEADVRWIRKTFYARCSIELTTFLATVFFFAFLVSN